MGYNFNRQRVGVSFVPVRRACVAKSGHLNNLNIRYVF
jgi:hypothetical protein